MRELARTWALLTGLISAAALLAAPGAFASHDAACQLLGTSAQRPKMVACNPRQNCFNATPGNPACNAALTSGECPGTETYNPRQECLAKLPALPAVSITRVEGGAAGENRTYAGRAEVLRVQGQNVGMAGNTAAGEAALIVDLLKPHYPNVDLTTVRFGYSNRQQPHNATTDCNRIYFNGEDYVRKLAAGALANTKEQNPLCLYHELRHTEQCAEWGGHEFYAAQWFKDFNLAVVQTQLQANPQAFMNDVHDKQGMEVDANARMRVVEKALPDGLSAQGTAGRR
jgi:hypothetical protein